MSSGGATLLLGSLLSTDFTSFSCVDNSFLVVCSIAESDSDDVGESSAVSPGTALSISMTCIDSPMDDDACWTGFTSGTYSGLVDEQAW